jgi:hypothetical protein
MKTYSVVIVTKFYKTIEVQAENEDEADARAWHWAEYNDPLHGADIETELYDLEVQE